MDTMLTRSLPTPHDQVWVIHLKIHETAMLPLVSVHILPGEVRGSATGSHMGKMANYPSHMDYRLS